MPATGPVFGPCAVVGSLVSIPFVIMKIILNPKYEHLRNYLKDLEVHFEREGKEIFRDRNVLRTLEVEGLTLCVKKYALPSLRARIAQRIYKSSKGKKAYFRPLELRERGFDSPEPVAFVRYPKGLLKSDTYFACLYSPYRYNLLDALTLPYDERCEVIRRFAAFAARLHEQGFLHRDFSSGNVLFDQVDGRYRFSLIDTNSMRIGRPVSVEKGCTNLLGLSGDDEFFTLLAKAYAEARGVPVERCIEIMKQSDAEH